MRIHLYLTVWHCQCISYNCFGALFRFSAWQIFSPSSDYFLLYVWLFCTLSNFRNAYSFVDHSQQYSECVWPAVFVLHLCIRLRHLLNSPVMIHICWRNSYPTTYHSFCCGLLYSDCLFFQFCWYNYYYCYCICWCCCWFSFHRSVIVLCILNWLYMCVEMFR